jgi:hypothetical protein
MGTRHFLHRLLGTRVGTGFPPVRRDPISPALGMVGADRANPFKVRRKRPPNRVGTGFTPVRRDPKVRGLAW